MLEARLDAVVRLAPIVLYALDREGVFTLSEGRGLEALGLHSGEVVGRSIFEHYAEYPLLLEDARAALSGAELSAIRQVGDLWFETRYTPQYDEAGVLMGTIGVATDVTASQLAQSALADDIAQRKQTEERLARSEADFRALLERSADAIGVESEGRLTYVNQAFVQYLGFEHAGELLMRPLLDVFQTSEQTSLKAEIERVVAGGESSPVMEHSLRRRDGSEVTAQVAVVGISFRDEPSALITARDVTERRRMQAQLRAADRMATVGTLTASIAHEINNPLAALLGNLELLEIEASYGSNATTGQGEALRDAREAASRLRHIVRDLRSFTHWDDEKRSSLDVRVVLDSALKLAANELKNRATIVKDYRVCPLVEANEVRLGQVFLNLIVNAAQSFPERPTEYNEIRILTHGAGAQVIVEVADNGSGIAPGILGRIFEPLFTTKPIGVGSGLGLAICKGIVTALGGTIEVKSELGRGTTFRVALPASEARATTPRSVWPARTHLEALRVLVIDDEPMIRRILTRALDAQHAVTAVSSAEAALALVAEGRRFDVVFCDLVMPEMDGMQFYERLERMSPALAERVVFMSGGVFTSDARAFVDRLGARHLPKPFDLKQVQAVLEGSVKLSSSVRRCAER